MNDQRSLLDPERLGWRIPEWARLTGVQTYAVYSQIRRGKLPIVRVGSSKLIPRHYAVECGLIKE